MSRRMAARKDANHNSIAGALQQLGFHVWDTSRLGDGGPDFVATGYSDRVGTVVSCLVEVKTKTGKLTDREAEFHGDFPQDGPLLVARTLDDVLGWFGRV